MRRTLTLALLAAIAAAIIFVAVAVLDGRDTIPSWDSPLTSYAPTTETTT